MATETKATHTPGLVIRFDGPPGPEAGRFVEVEIDGASVRVGEWMQDGEYWLLRFDPVYAAAPSLLAALEELVNSPNAKQNAMWDRARTAIAQAKGTT